MVNFILRLLSSAAAVMVASTLFPQAVRVADFTGAVVFAVVLGLLNAFVRPILLLLALPLNLMTLGLFTLVVNALVFWLATGIGIGGVEVDGFGGAFVGALAVSFASFVASRAFK